MADAAVQFLLENLTHLLIQKYELISNIEKEVKELVKNMEFFKSFLKKVSGKKLRKNDTLRELVGDIRNVIYDADDVMDAYITQAAEKKKARNYFTADIDLLKIATKVNDICSDINKIYGSKDKFDLVNFASSDDGHDEKPPEPTPRVANVVGLEDEVKKIVGYLTDRTPYLDVISIIGMPGLGKTTLTGKIYSDEQIKIEFPTRIWVYVSSDFKEKEVFLSILKQLKTKLDEGEYGKKTIDDLAKEIEENLDQTKFLLVMDDVWEPTDWEKLQRALPKRNMMGKVMITSRSVSVGRATKAREPHQLRPMNIYESCELLQREVFNKPEFPPEFARVGKEIASKCAGLPLAIVVIGGVLTSKVSRSVDKWENVSKSVPTFINEEDGNNRMDTVISMSYLKLPYHLKECFLYLAMFPEDSEISAWKLVRMWIAEGLIEPKENMSMEERGEFYLDELISRNLVRVERLRSNGSVKTCRMHDMLRDFCKREGGKDGAYFLKEIRETGDGGLQTIVEKDRRICIHSKVFEFLSRNPRGASLRSFVTLSKDTETTETMPADKISTICAAFKLVRVLEAQCLMIDKIPTDFYHLVHLRYLVLSLKLPEPGSTKNLFRSSPKHPSLPLALERLWNLQTLVVKTPNRVLEIKANIMSMSKLKHVKSNASIILPDPGSSTEGAMLQTLSTIAPRSYTKAILGKAKKLKKLGIRGKLSSFLDAKTGAVDSLKELTDLEKLKLVNDAFPEPASKGKLVSFPRQNIFPTGLKSLTIEATHLDWSNINVLALATKLQVLKLKDYAFVGLNWALATPEVFVSLKYLVIARTDLMNWEASAHHFPMLKRLKLQNCDGLVLIPIDIPVLEHLEIQSCKKAAPSARKIAEAKKDVPAFKLSISLG